MKSSYLFTILLSVFLLIGVGCQNQKSSTPLPPAAITTQTQAMQQKESDSKSESSALGGDTSISIDKDFRIFSVSNSEKIGDPVTSVFPIYAYMCDIYEIKNGVPLRYSKIDFFISKNRKNAPTILLGTTPGGSAGSQECDLHENESSLTSKLEAGEYRIWAVRYIDNKPDKRTPDVFITLK